MPNRYIVEVFFDDNGEYRWRVVSAQNGQTVGTIGEGNVDKSHVLEMVGNLFPGFEIKDLTRKP